MTQQFKINNFDLLRIFAASQVMVGHAVVHLDVAAPLWLMKLVHAFPGVPIFFVISGFLISASYERSTSLKSYARNRALRIFPGLWCCILVTILIASLCGFSFLNGEALTWTAAQFAGAIYTPGFLKGFGTGSYNGSLWTIPVELQFYIVLPALYWLIGKKGVRDHARFFWLTWFAFVAIGFAASFLIQSLDGPQSEPVLQKLFRYSFFPYFFLFMTGVIMQRQKLHAAKWLAGKGMYWLAAYLAFYYLVPATAATYALTTLLLAVVTVSVAYTRPQTAQEVLRGNDISYGVYIYHGLLVNFFVEMGLTGSTKLLVLLAVCTYLLGYVSWIGVERPFLRRKKQTISPTLETAKEERSRLSAVLSFTGKT